MFIHQIKSNNLCAEAQELVDEPEKDQLIDQASTSILEAGQLKQSVKTVVPALEELEGKEEIEDKEGKNNTSKSNDVDPIPSATPLIPETVYQTLPDFFKRAIGYYQANKRQRDVFLTSLISALSGCPFDISGIYRGKRVYTTLYSFVIAPPASGKGVVADPKQIIQPLFKFLIDPANSPEPMRLLIPGDVSAAMLFQLLYGNDGWGVMILPEADTFGNGKKQEWGKIDDKIRQNWHHESFQIGRKGSNEYFDLETPRMSMTLAGTPNQVTGVVSNTVDGLFSRFIFYKFSQDMGWMPLESHNFAVDINAILNGLGTELIGMFKRFKATPSSFCFTPEQTRRFDAAFKQHYDNAEVLVGEDGSSLVKRMALIAFRIAMLFTAFRSYEQGVIQSDLHCSEEDFTNALALADVYLMHSMAVLDAMPENYFEAKDKKTRLFIALPMEFSRMQALEVAAGLSIPQRTADRYLKDLLGTGKLVSSAHGMYRKK